MRDCRSRYQACRMSDLRPAMGNLDPRFRGNATATGSTGMISALLHAAERRGLVSVDWTLGFPNPPVCLAQGAVTQGETAPTTGSTPEQTAQVATTRDVISEPAKDATPVQIQTLAETGGPPQTPEPGDAGGPPQAPEPGIEHPSRVLEERLKAVGKEPFTVARIPMYQALEAIVGEKKLSLSSLIDAAEKRVSEKLPSQPWRRIRRLLLWVLTEAGVALAEGGKPIPQGLCGQLQTVHSFASDWQIRADAEILLVLLVANDGICAEAVEDLAGLLYHSRQVDARTSASRNAISSHCWEGTRSAPRWEVLPSANGSGHSEGKGGIGRLARDPDRSTVAQD
jgi:hypothetical protein